MKKLLQGSNLKKKKDALFHICACHNSIFDLAILASDAQLGYQKESKNHDDSKVFIYTWLIF